MNHVFRLIWSPRAQALVAVSETASACGKRSQASAMLIAGVLLAAPGIASASPVLPAGEVIKSGKVEINRTDNAMTIVQSDARAAIDWQSFSIGQQGKVDFQQPKIDSVILNRVVGNEASLIEGALTANGQVFLLNSNGILFSQGARIDVGGLVASTAHISDQDWKHGKYNLTDVAKSAASVSNQGKITTRDGGGVALLGATVTNEGEISARLGRVVMASGDKFTLTPNGSSFGVAIDAGIADGLVKNGHLIQADGGEVLLTAKGMDDVLSSVVNNTGEIQARTMESLGGKILLRGEGNTKVEVAGKLDATIAMGSVTKGGVIEITGPQVALNDEARVTLGAGGGLVIETPSVVAIGAPSVANGSTEEPQSTVGADALHHALASSGDVAIRTVGMADKAKEIHINAPFNWHKNTLTLRSGGNIQVNEVITANGKAKLDMQAGYVEPGYVWGYSFTGKHAVQMNMALDQSGRRFFKGRIDFPGRSDTDALSINDEKYTLISDRKALEEITNTGLSKKYALGAEINTLPASVNDPVTPFTPIGSARTPFTGALDGLGHSINNLTIENGTHTDAVGLIRVANGAKFKNVALNNVFIEGHQKVGSLVGDLQGGEISNAIVSGEVKGIAVVGGIVGKGSKMVMSDSHFSGTVKGNCCTPVSQLGGDNNGNFAATGGLVGHLDNPWEWFGYAEAGITKSTVEGRIDAIGGGLGGAVGVFTGQPGKSSLQGLEVSASISALGNGGAAGDVRGVGGIVGASQNVAISSVKFTGNVEAPKANAVGGVAGFMKGSTIEDSHVAGNQQVGSKEPSVLGYSGVGGLVGEAKETKISASTFQGSAVAGVSQVGGLVGRFAGGSIDNTSVITNIRQRNVTPSIGGEDFGGLIGRVEGATVSNSHPMVSVTAPSATAVGGLFGSSLSTTISDTSWPGGDVIGSDRVGGLIGDSNRTIVRRVAPNQCQGDACVGIAASLPGLQHISGNKQVGVLGGYLVRGEYSDIGIPPNRVTVGGTVDDSGNHFGEIVRDASGWFELDIHKDPVFKNIELIDPSKAAVAVVVGGATTPSAGNSPVGGGQVRSAATSNARVLGSGSTSPSGTAANAPGQPQTDPSAGKPRVPVGASNASSGSSQAPNQRTTAETKTAANVIDGITSSRLSAFGETSVLADIADHACASLVPRGSLSSNEFMVGHYNESLLAQASVMQREPSVDRMFEKGAPLSIVSETSYGEFGQPVTIDEAKRMVVSPGSKHAVSLRVPVKRKGTLLETVEGGVRLPSDVRQVLFVVKTH